MNGIHDMGGMHGFGPVIPEKDEPVFHEPWEGRLFAINLSTRQPGGLRPAIESIPPAQYLGLSYYERWLQAKIAGLVKGGLITEDELEEKVRYYRSDPDSEIPRAFDAEKVEERRQALADVTPPEKEPQGDAQFKVGDTVRALNANPTGHTRLPRYIRGRLGKVQRLYGWHELHDPGESGEGREKIEPVYSVRFEGSELWGESAEPNQSVYIDMWESYLESA